MIINGLTLRSSNPFQKSIVFSISICIIFLITTGFYIPNYAMPSFVQIINIPNFTRIYFESWMMILYKDRCQVTSSVFNSYGISESQLTENLYTLIFEGVILQIIALIIHIFNLNKRD